MLFFLSIQSCGDLNYSKFWWLTNMDYLYRWVALCTKAVEIAFYNHLKALFLLCPAIGNAYLSFISISLLSGFSIIFYIVGSLLPILHLVKSWRILVLNCCFAFWDEFWLSALLPPIWALISSFCVLKKYWSELPVEVLFLGLLRT